MFFSDEEIRTVWANEDIVYTLGFFIGLFSVFLPFLFLALVLVFSRKVKMFFNPSLLLQIDALSTIFHEPPPPPRFDE